MRIRKLCGTSRLTLVLAVFPGAQPKDGGLAFVQLDDGKPLQFVLGRRYFRMAWILVMAKLNDPNSDSPAWGIQRPEMLTRAYAIQDGVLAEIQLEGVKHLVKGIRDAVKVTYAKLGARAGWSPIDPKREIIETIWGQGYRIGYMNVVLIDQVEDHSTPSAPDTPLTTFTIPT
jgi:hypothetical protein